MRKRRLCLIMLITMIMASTPYSCGLNGGITPIPPPNDGENLSEAVEIPSDPPVDPSLILHLKFNEVDDGKVNDASGHDHCIVHGDAIINQGDAVEGASIELDGDSDYITVSHDDMKPFPSIRNSEFTVSVWVKAFSFPADEVSIAEIISNALNSVSGFDIMILGYANNNIENNPRFSAYTGNAQWGLPAVIGGGAQREYYALNLNEWYNIAGTYLFDKSLHDGRGGFVTKVYVNGELLGENKSESLIATPTGRDIQIGCGYKSNEELAYYFNGLIDEVRIYSKALKAEEIMVLYTEDKQNLL